jgi:hypothetical protein
LIGRECPDARILPHGSLLLSAYGCATVPHVCLVLRKSYGGASVLSFAANIRLALPTARIGPMGADATLEVVFGPEGVTCGAKADLPYATRVAREMVYTLGLGPGTGLVAFDVREGGGAVSGELHAAMDRDMRGIVEALYARVREAVERHRAALEALADALLERETLEGAEAIAILHAHGVTTDDPLRRRRGRTGSCRTHQGAHC